MHINQARFNECKRGIRYYFQESTLQPSGLQKIWFYGLNLVLRDKKLSRIKIRDTALHRTFRFCREDATRGRHTIAVRPSYETGTAVCSSEFILKLARFPPVLEVSGSNLTTLLGILVPSQVRFLNSAAVNALQIIPYSNVMITSF
jgi:hypothetical protein